MASNNNEPAPVKQRAGVKLIRRSAPRVDMTPMVDLGFLLISFFVMTATMSERKTMPLFMPVDGPPDHAPESTSVTLLLDGDKAWYYEGLPEPALRNKTVRQTSFDLRTGIGAVLRSKQQRLKGRKDQLVYMIKSTTDARYGAVVDALDEATINQVKRFALVKISPEEQRFLDERP